MADSWYAAKLAQMRGEQPQQPQQAAPPVTYNRDYLTPFEQHQPATPAAPQQQQQSLPQRYITYNAAGQQADDDGFVRVINEAAATTGGSKIVKDNSTQCPQCYGDKLFTILEGAIMTKNGDRVQAQQCAECGYPSKNNAGIVASGEIVRVQGDAQHARQLPKGHVLNVINEGGRSINLGQIK